jgi:hypothetical protein
VSGVTRAEIRNSTVYASGTGTNIIGVETTNSGSICDILITTVSGATKDISRTFGTILLGSSNLVNNSANGNSFTTTSKPSNLVFGVHGNISNATSYLLPSVTKDDILPTSVFQIPIVKNMVLFTGVIKYVGNAIGTGKSLILEVHKNGNASPVYTITLGVGETTKSLLTTSYDFIAGDTIDVRTVCNFNTGDCTFISILGFY